MIPDSVCVCVCRAVSMVLFTENEKKKNYLVICAYCSADVSVSCRCHIKARHMYFPCSHIWTAVRRRECSKISILFLYVAELRWCRCPIGKCNYSLLATECRLHCPICLRRDYGLRLLLISNRVSLKSSYFSEICIESLHWSLFWILFASLFFNGCQ